MKPAASGRSPRCWSARLAATLDRLSGGRLLVNLVTGGDAGELAGDRQFLDRAVRRGGGQQLCAGIRSKKLLLWLLPPLLLLTWEIACRSGALSSRILPVAVAVAVLAAFWALLRSGELAHHEGASSVPAFSALALGGGLGLLLGLLTGTWRTAETLLDTTLQRVRNIAALALIPLVLLWFGIDETAKLFIVAVGVFFPVYLNTFHGIRGVDRDLNEMRAATASPAGSATARSSCPARCRPSCWGCASGWKCTG